MTTVLGEGSGRSAARRNVLWGVLLIIAGLLAIAMPGVAALSTTLVYAWLLLLAGGFEIVYAIQTRHAPGFAWKLLSGVLAFVLGLAILFVPVAGTAALAMLIGAFLFGGGIVRLVLAFRLRPFPGWGWILLDGIVSILVAVLIGIGWPQNSLPFIGLLTGFWLITAGVWRVMLR